MINDYQKNSPDDFKLDQAKVSTLLRHIHTQLKSIEEKLTHKNGDREVRVIESREGIVRGSEQRRYAKAYNQLNEAIFANKNY